MAFDDVFLTVDTAMLLQSSLTKSLNGYFPPQWNEHNPSHLEIFDTVTAKRYYVDGIIRADYTGNRLTITSHPVQDSANKSDHAYRTPKKIAMEVRFSDVLGDYHNTYSEGGTKCQAVYQSLIRLQESKHPLNITTKFQTYEGWLIEDINIPDDISTNTALKMYIVFQEVLTAVVSKNYISNSPQVTQFVTRGTVNPSPIQRLGNMVLNRIKSRATLTSVLPLLTGVKQFNLSSIIK